MKYILVSVLFFQAQVFAAGGANVSGASSAPASVSGPQAMNSAMANNSNDSVSANSANGDYSISQIYELIQKHYSEKKFTKDIEDAVTPHLANKKKGSLTLEPSGNSATVAVDSDKYVIKMAGANPPKFEINGQEILFELKDTPDASFRRVMNFLSHEHNKKNALQWLLGSERLHADFDWGMLLKGLLIFAGLSLITGAINCSSYKTHASAIDATKSTTFPYGCAPPDTKAWRNSGIFGSGIGQGLEFGFLGSSLFCGDQKAKVNGAAECPPGYSAGTQGTCPSGYFMVNRGGSLVCEVGTAYDSTGRSTVNRAAPTAPARMADPGKAADQGRAPANKKLGSGTSQ